MDFIVGLPPSGRFDTILVVVDRLSKYAHFICLSHPFTAKGVATIFCKEIIRLHGFPRSIISDRDLYIFFHRLWTRTSTHHSVCLWRNKNEEVEQQLVARDDMLKLLRSNLQKAQDRMRAQANLKRQELTFKIGDYVFLKIQPYRRKSLSKRRYEKLSPRFFGPYRIKRAIGHVAYELELPPDARIHPVFHISMLKPARGNFSSTPLHPLPITKDWELDLQPESILSHRWVSEAGQQVLELLVSWCHRPVEEATWENYDLFVTQFPTFRLEDKSFFQEGSNDKAPLKVYSRKRKRVGEINMGQLIYVFSAELDPLGQPNCGIKEEWGSSSHA
ncbi:uncharacterized protein LOC110876059 [Helianthus annuus]|uniref:uncharacterized protein LOC110876059 n=1 Tax=Helianthus annuus TaxID=4232 RepID=UPI000B90889C|nr:uncharacterized protein LOC110876059 [Helianthus annuus]